MANDADDLIPPHLRRFPTGPLPDDLGILLGKVLARLDDVREDVGEIKKDVKELTAAHASTREQTDGLKKQAAFQEGRVNEMYTAVTVSRGLVWILKFGSLVVAVVAGAWAGLSWLVGHVPHHSAH